jgi:glucosylceramidase
MKEKVWVLFILLGVFWMGVALAKTSSNVEICTEKSCQVLDDVQKAELENDQVIVFESIKGSHTFLKKDGLNHQFSSKPSGWFWHTITINKAPTIKGSPIIGFGGAFSDATTILYHAMTPALKKALITSYFGKEGIAYSLGRVPIASSDFSCRDKNGIPSLKACDKARSQYSYVDTFSETLDGFALQVEDTDYRMPMMHDAMEILKKEGGSLSLYASPWSAPYWMKTNQSMVHGGLLPDYRGLWGDYFIEFLQAYREKGLAFWGITVQNEPVEEGFLGTKDMQTWQTMYSTESEQADFIEHYLGPKLKAYNQTLSQPVKLIVHDDQITTIEKRVGELMLTGASDYIDGAGLHWYMNNLLPLSNDYPKLDKAFETLHKKDEKPRFIIGTEACEGYLTGVPGMTGPKLGSWSRGESYAHDIISDLNHHVTGWTDWNLMLDMKGGPNWAGNYVDAPILVDIEKQLFYRQPMFYYMGHFSKFIRPGSLLQPSASQGPAPIEEVVYTVPATSELPTHTVMVVLNRDFTGRHYLIEDKRINGESRFLDLTLPAHSIQTIIYRSF